MGIKSAAYNKIFYENNMDSHSKLDGLISYSSSKDLGG
jgi:hypothetical protein